MDIRFEEFSEKLSKTAESVGNKASEMVQITKIKKDIHSLKQANNQDYKEIGKLIYNMYLKDVVHDPEIMDICDTISERDIKIEECRKELSSIKGERLCPCCGKYYSDDMVYCPYCGERVSE